MLVEPERCTNGKDFPSDTFTIHVKFTDKDGEITKVNLNADGKRIFGISENSGVWYSLVQAKFDVNRWDYDDTKEPTEVLAGTGSRN